ncbi:hypothetical protein [Parathalassolituus penaei]|uniref:Uncharacterized protein n=1 Tax=Parathalassolituus penaei TaxID=2997323 RepID=A0A9X3EBD9_9GAMM|nr:hypothetical protein [Parathalassolituus penaei]MCY0964422.1 hypothetical protein [Parathalassolituus penaei]
MMSKVTGHFFPNFSQMYRNVSAARFESQGTIVTTIVIYNPGNTAGGIRIRVSVHGADDQTEGIRD